MPDKEIEIRFLCLIFLSLLLHAAVFFLLINLPAGKTIARQQPLMVDLADIRPELKSEGASPPVDRFAEQRQRVVREKAPKGEDLRTRPTPPAAISAPVTREVAPAPVLPGSQPGASPPPAASGRDRSPKEELFRRQPGAPAGSPSLVNPDLGRLARIEESLRKKYGAEVVDGDTSFLNTDDIRFGSFLRRFETAVYAVWRYPTEAARLGVEGMTPVRISFNRRGEIVGIEILRSSGSNILDNEVLRTLRQIGSVGSFPKGYDKDTFNLIAFFHYNIMQGATRSLR